MRNSELNEQKAFNLIVTNGKTNNKKKFDENEKNVHLRESVYTWSVFIWSRNNSKIWHREKYQNKIWPSIVFEY